MDFIKKPINEFSSSFNNGTYSKPATCPHCGYGVDAPVIEKHTLSMGNNTYILTGICRCTHCSNTFFFACFRNLAKSPDALCTLCFPSNSFVPYKNDVLSKISERFIQMYNQALNAEFNRSLDLAAIGYRSSLEILVKDYAISELGVSEDEAGKKSLCDAIGTYLKQDELVKTADVIRILGNDYTHFKRKYPDFDFNLLKYYMVIFMKQIEAQYMIHHPPVERHQD